ncbi:unnamed protein product [Chilo suppressalis]|uniref:CBF1-interacting co-repressor CIR N-terminal domain-containing protein n=1 Tax=Chilo suppressalis TaxID=168631 RepID=A0ABN8ASJ3_CHISP|nr:hypothetical protein evm_006697 [Chilo suppressalis]CAH0398781.1 unnamed protein product [Chilo suppressalis]
MNILPKKRWHVRTKENIARVRKDEAEAAEKQRQEKLRIETADREARLNILKQNSKIKLHELGIDIKTSSNDADVHSQHINLFLDIEHSVNFKNKEHEKEIKEKQEEYEKKIGYLTYLGQNTNEILKKKNWYEVAPSARIAESNNIKDTYEKLVLKDVDGKPKQRCSDVLNGECDWKSKQKHDPINKFRKYCGETSGKDKNNKNEEKNNRRKDVSSKEDKNKKLQKLREARLKREQEEKYKTDVFLSGFSKSTTTCATETKAQATKIKPKYNSQFNPELARQNYK